MPEEDALKVRERALISVRRSLMRENLLMNVKPSWPCGRRNWKNSKRPRITVARPLRRFWRAFRRKLEEIKRVANIYSNMAPDKAAEILENIYGNIEMSL